ncbi:putative Terminase small subunit, partial [Vibrio phage 137E35-1]
MANKLNDQRERFCEEYIIDLNATAAAIRAGYSKKTARSQGQRLLTNVDIQARIQELKAARSDRTGLSADWVMEQSRRVFEKCMQDEPVLTKKGEPVIIETPDGKLNAAYKFDSTGANNALKLIYTHVSKPEEDGQDEAPPISIVYEVSEAVGDIKVTIGRDKAKVSKGAD